jgi:hypothetical protein
MEVFLQNIDSVINEADVYLLGLSVLDNPVGDGLYVNVQLLNKNK